MLTFIELKRIHGVSWGIFLFTQSSPPAALSANDAILLNIALGRWRKSSNRSLFKAMKGWGAVSHIVLFLCMDCGLLETLTDQNACIINNNQMPVVLLCRLVAILDSGPPMVQNGRRKNAKMVFWQFQIQIFAKNHIGKNYAKNPTTANFVT